MSISTHDLLIITSLGLSVTLLCYYVEGLILWWPTFKKSLKEHSANDNLAQGIWIGFAAPLLDNLYWGFTWAFLLFETKIGAVMLSLGAGFNIFFRQTGGLWSVMKHIRAANQLHRHREELDHTVFYWLAGLATFLSLYYFDTL